MSEGVVYSVENDKKIMNAFREMMIADERISQERSQKNEIVKTLAADIDVEKKCLTAAYKMYVKSLEGDEKPVNASETALNITNRLNNMTMG